MYPFAHAHISSVFPEVSLEDFQVHDGSSVEIEDMANMCYSIWVSFAEIYNELIYDLLAEEHKHGRSHPSLKLAEDRNHNHFIKGGPF